MASATDPTVAASPPDGEPDLGAPSLGAAFARVRIPVLAAYGALTLVWIVAFGLPDRPYVLLWIVALVALVTWHNPNRVARVVWDWWPILIITAGYDFVRSFAPDLVPRATTEPQLRFDEIVFGGKVPTIWIQEALVDRGTPHWWDFIAWVIYLSHFVVTLGLALWLYVRHREWFHRFAMLILTVSLAGFVTYFLVPAVPPWLASRNGDLEPTVRVVHAVWDNIGFEGAAKVFAGDAKLANPVAALPSLHAAWPFMALLYFWTKLPRGRWLLLGYNAVMIFVLVYGAEHYVSDILLGWCYATVAFIAVNWVMDRNERRRAAARGAAA
jgi:hypothetical protein